MDAPTLAHEISRMQADLCSAFADSSRLLILYALDEKPRNVTQLANDLDISQPSTSRHLKVLRDRGLVVALRQGASIQYRIADPRLLEALDILRTVLRDRLHHEANLMREADE